MLYYLSQDIFICQCGYQETALKAQTRQSYAKQQSQEFRMLLNAYQQMWQHYQQNSFYGTGIKVPWDDDTPKKIEKVWYCELCGEIYTDCIPICKCPSVCVALELEMTPVTNVKIWWDTSVSAYRMTSPFNRELVDGIKAFIPVSDRSYDPQTKVWTFVERQLLALEKLFVTLGVKPVVVTRAQAEQASQSTPTQQRGKPLDAVVMEFVRLVPQDCMIKAYRAAAMTLHPDRGGSMDKMSALNAAWDRMQKELYGSQS